MATRAEIIAEARTRLPAAPKKLPGFKVGNQWRFNHQMIEAWLMKNAKNARK
jgi:hypothetical protein